MRVATCCCEQLAVTCAGEPVRVSICHCRQCQKRTGSVFAVQARFPRDQVAAAGRSNTFERVGENGEHARFHFCPDCGSTVFWEMSALPEFVAVAVGAFAEPGFPPPTVSVYEERMHRWARMPDLEVEHIH